MSPAQDAAGDLTLEDLWDEAEANFQRLAGASLRTRSKNGIEEVMTRLDAKYGTGKHDGHAKTKRIASNVISIIQNLGGLAIQGASMAFGPAQLCFSAFSFLLDIPSKIDKVFGSIGTLFEALEHYLVKLEIYKRIEKSTQLPHELLWSTNTILTKFVEICALAYGLAFGSKAAKFKAGALAALSKDDSGVSGALEEFNKLINKQGALESSLNLEYTIEIEKNVQHIPDIATGVTEIRKVVGDGMETLITDVRTRTIDKLADEQRASLIKALDLPKEVIDEQERILDAMRADSLPDSGDVLQKDSAYLSWSDFTSDAHPALFLSGEPHSGKSYLVHAVVDAMKSGNIGIREANAPASRVIVANYFFQKPDDRAMTSDAVTEKQNAHPIETAIKHVCLQISLQHKGYAKEMLNLLKKTKTRGRPADQLWDDLLIGRPKSDSVYVLIFDGIDQLPDPELDTFFDLIERQVNSSDGMWSAFPNRSKVRILVSSMSRALPKKTMLDVPVLDAVQLNVSNIRSFIDQELKRGKLWQEDTVQTKALTAFIRETLPDSSKGDFALVIQALDSVRQAVEDGRGLENAKTALLDACDEDPLNIAPKVIEDLGRSLTIQDIKRLNNLLMWVIWARNRFTLKELRAASFLDSRDDPCQSFDTIMKTKYARIFSVGSDDTVLVRDEIYFFLRENAQDRAPTTQTKDSAGPTISMEIRINNASLSQVRRFLWNLNERANLEPFLFDSTDSHVEERVIQCYSLDSQVHITVKLLELLNDEFDEITEPLFTHACIGIVPYLRRLFYLAIDGMLVSDELRAILSGIIAFLSEPEMIDQHDFSPTLLRDNWVLSEQEELSIVFRDWLTLDEAIKTLDRKDRRRLNALMDSSQGYLSFYKPLTKVMANRWLRSTKQDPEHAYHWIDSVLESERLSGDYIVIRSRTPDLERVDTAESFVSHRDFGSPARPPELTEISRVRRALDWARMNLEHMDEDYLYYQRLGETYWVLGEDDEAIVTLDAGKAKFPDNWRLYAICASAYAGEKNWKRAIKEMEEGFQILHKRPGVDLKAEPGYVSDVRHLTAWYLNAKLYDDTIRQAQEGLVLDPMNQDYHIMTLEAKCESGAISEAKSYFTEALAESGADGMLTKMVEVMKYATDSSAANTDMLYFDKILMCAIKADAVPTMLEALRTLNQQQFAKDNINYYTVCRIMEAAVLSFVPTDGARHNSQVAIEIGEEIINNADLVESYEFNDEKVVPFFRITQQILAASYLQRMLKSLQSPQDNEENIKKLNDLVNLSRPKLRLFPEGVAQLVTYYIKIGEKEKARDLLRPTLEEFLDMLVDDTPDNDPEAFYWVALILGIFQDDYNSLTAWSLLVPFDADIGLDAEHMISDDEVEIVSHETRDISNIVRSAIPINENLGAIMRAINEGTQEHNSDNTEDAKHEVVIPQQEDAKLQSLASSPEHSETTEPALEKIVTKDVPLLKEVEVLSKAVPAEALNGEEITPDVQTNGISEAQEHNEDVDANAIHSHPKSVSSEALDKTEQLVWLRMKRAHMSPTTLEAEENVSWTFDPHNDDYVIIKNKLERDQLERMFEHTKKLLQENWVMQFRCGGWCQTTWNYASDFYLCRNCNPTLLCPSCMEKIKDDDPKHIIACASHHEWLYIPRHSNQRYKDIGKGMVRVDGEIGEDGRIVGGRVVPFQEWLNTVRKDWGLTTLEAEYRWVQRAQAGGKTIGSPYLSRLLT